MERKEEIIQLLKESKLPLSGTDISKKLNVSRQVIVQDIALLRASNVEIISTNKGYIINEELKRVFKVKHKNEDIFDELSSIVDLGAKVVDCFIIHDVYKEINVSLNINSRKDINDFINLKNNDLPLMQITNDIHYHTVKADSIEILNLVETALKEKGYLID